MDKLVSNFKSITKNVSIIIIDFINDNVSYRF